MLKKVVFISLAAFLLLIGIALALSVAVAGAGFSLLGSVAVIPLKGEITDSQPLFSSGFGATEIVEKLSEADEDPGIAAVLLDIDSGGGEIVATKQIVYKVREMNKPVVAYMGGAGASGAYYVAAATDYIVADADTITGSIGVISIIPNIEGLLEDFGIRMEIVKEGRFKDIASPFSELDDEERAILQSITRSAFERFKADILSFRSGRLGEQEFLQVADGRILSGEQAFSRSLVDELGTRQDAVNRAAELAGIPANPALRHYSKEAPTLLELLTAGGYSFGLGLRQGLSETGTSLPTLRS